VGERDRKREKEREEERKRKIDSVVQCQKRPSTVSKET
jgi:hypothetical protein